MKVRTGFVSNSSSSSFIIHKGFLTEQQILDIFNYVDIVKDYIKNNPMVDDDYYGSEFDFSYVDDRWNIKDHPEYIFGETSMDNFSFFSFLKYIKVDDSLICWDEGYVDEPYPQQLEFLNKQRKKLRANKLKKIKKGQ